MSEGAVNVSLDGMVLYCNQRFADMAKADLSTIMGSNLLAYFVAEDRARITTALGRSGPPGSARRCWRVDGKPCR